MEGCETGVETEDWRVVHQAIVDLARRKGAWEAEEVRWLLAGERAQVHLACGLGTYLEYLEAMLGYSPRRAAERLRVARALAELPVLYGALAQAELPWSAVRELSRVATSETEAEWMAAVVGMNLRQIEQLVSGRERGDRPGDAARPDVRRHVVALDLSAETYARYREVVAVLTREAGERLSDDEVVRELANRVLAGTGAGGHDGRATYQVAITWCQSCERAWQDGGGRSIEVGEVGRQVAACDAQHIGSAGADSPDRASQDIRPATRRLVKRRDHGCCQVPGCRNAAFTEIHHLRFRAVGGKGQINNLLLLCSAHHTRVHEGLLIIEGNPRDGLTFRHPDGRPYGTLPAPPAFDALAPTSGAPPAAPPSPSPSRPVPTPMAPQAAPPSPSPDQPAPTSPAPRAAPPSPPGWPAPTPPAPQAAPPSPPDSPTLMPPALHSATTQPAAPAQPAESTASSKLVADIVGGLCRIGVKRDHARRAATAAFAACGPGAGAEALLRAALAELASVEYAAAFS